QSAGAGLLCPLGLRGDGHAELQAGQRPPARHRDAAAAGARTRRLIRMPNPGRRVRMAGLLLLAAAVGAPLPGAGRVSPAKPPALPPGKLARPSTGSTLYTYSPLVSMFQPAVLVGAGDIADCATGWDEQTAALVAAITGTVVTMGDNAYENGTP